MRMRFDENDERAFAARRDQLVERFAGWLLDGQRDGDPSDAGLLLDWRFGYGDGRLDVWTVADVAEFLLGWCPRKLTAAPAEAAEVPVSVAAFVEFLDSTGLLARSSDRPERVRTFCETNLTRFLREMSNPANFGMAKSLISGLGAPDELDLPDDLRDILLGQDDEDRAVVGPVRLPSGHEQRDAVRAAPAFRQLSLLAGYCAPPGRTLTGKGNLRLADARHLVTALETGDDPEFGGGRTLTSAEDLPVLSWLFELALAAGAVRRVRGRLVAVAKFAALDEPAAYEKVVRAAVAAGLSPTPYWVHPAIEAARATVNEAVVGLLAELLDAGDEAVPKGELVGLMRDWVSGPSGLQPFVDGLLPGMVETQLRRLVALGMVTVDGDAVSLTAAGVPAAVGLVRDAGIDVVLRPDPATADAAAIADLLDVEERPEWVEDAGAWLAERPDRAAALDQLVDAVLAEDRPATAVMAGLDVLEDLAGDEVVPGVQRQVGGPHDGLVLNWLAGRSALDLATVDPMRLVAGLVDVLVVSLDLGGPQELVAALDHGAQRDQQLDLMEHIWRLDHPRLADVLQAIGAHHPVKAVAKAARKAVIRHRSYLANPPGR